MSGLRFVKGPEIAALSNLWHLSRTALSAPGGPPTKHARMLWTADAFHQEHPHVKSLAAYKDLDAMLDGLPVDRTLVLPVEETE